MNKIYYNGDFITLESEKNKVEAIFIEDGMIKKVGKKEQIFAYKNTKTKMIDLRGKTMMPSFIDAHSHFSGVANHLLKINLEKCKNFEEIQRELIKFVKENKIKEENWIIGTGYDHNNLQEKKNPTKEIIDEVLPNYPVVLEHKSCHAGVFNSMALNRLNVTNKVENIDGGKIEKNGQELTGYMEEKAFLMYQKQIPLPDIKTLLEAYDKAQREYAEYGITTIQDGMAYKSIIPIYEELIRNNKLQLDLVIYFDPKDKNIFFNQFKDHIRTYKKRFKIGGYKIFLDGSPQARTAWMRMPYQGEKDYWGYGTMKKEEVEDAIRKANEDKMQLLAHCNGDMAAKQYIDCIEKYKEIEKLRPVMIHAQFLGVDQIKKVKECGIIPSFFIAHVFYWGDTHIKNFGLERASKISPANTALKEGIPFNFHQDSPVIKPNMFETIWCAVTRKTKEGKILGEEEKITVLDAIKAVTIHSAYQYFEEKKKGSIKEGKLADLIIINKNPLKIEKEEIKDIRVLETLKEGKVIYKNQILNCL